MEKYILSRTGAPHQWQCVDTDNGLTCTFEQGKFNETQRFSFSSASEIATNENADKIAKIVNDMNVYLRVNHYHIAMPYSDDAARVSMAVIITARRKALGMTQEDLADKSELHRSHITRIEQGKYNITIEVIGKIAHALGCHVALVPNNVE